MTTETKIDLVKLYAGLVAQGLASTETPDAEWEPKVLAERSVEIAIQLAREVERRSAGAAANPSTPTSGSKR